MSAAKVPAHCRRPHSHGDRPFLNALQELDLSIRLLVDAVPGAQGRYESALTRVEDLEAWGAEARLDRALTEFGAITDRRRRPTELSVVQRYRVRLACLLSGDQDILLLDDPPTTLTTRAWSTWRRRSTPTGVWSS